MSEPQTCKDKVNNDVDKAFVSKISCFFLTADASSYSCHLCTIFSTTASKGSRQN